MPTYSPIVELRQYTLRPGTRDTMMALFDREFVEGQEATGMKIIGQFRDLDDPNRFVWLRGFSDMTSRAEALTAFYSGPIWTAHRDAARTTMVDTDNALLLRPAHAASGFRLADGDRLPHDAGAVSRGLVVATIHAFDSAPDAEWVNVFERELMPVLANAGASIAGYFVSEGAANTYPALPLREGEHLFIWFARFADEAAYEAHVAARNASPQWRDLVLAASTPPSVLRLSPTLRSLLHG